MKKFLIGVYETLVLYLRGKDENKAKRVTALVVIALLAPMAVPAYYKIGYGIFYAMRNNLPPASVNITTSLNPRFKHLVVDNDRDLPVAGPPAPRNSGSK